MPSPTALSARATRGRRLLLLAASTCLSLLAAELALRAYDALRGKSPQARTYWFWGFQQDRLLGYRVRPGVRIELGKNSLFEANSEGFREREIPVVTAERRRLVVCVGESSTWGTGAPDRTQTWPSYLERELRRSSTEPYVVMNAGIPGYSMLENLPLLNHRLLKWKPEVVLYMGFRNDFYAYAWRLDERLDVTRYPRVLAPLPDTWPNRLLMRSSLIGFVATQLGNARGFETAPEAPLTHADGDRLSPRGESTFRDQVALIAELTRRHGARLAWIDQPIEIARVGADRRRPLEDLRGVLHDELERLGVPLLEAHARYDFERFPLIDDVHLSPQGNEALARLLAPQLFELIEPRHAAPPAPANADAPLPNSGP